MNEPVPESTLNEVIYDHAFHHQLNDYDAKECMTCGEVESRHRWTTTFGKPDVDGTFSCLICGVDTPHDHTSSEIAEFRAGQEPRMSKSALPESTLLDQVARTLMRLELERREKKTLDETLLVHSETERTFRRLISSHEAQDFIEYASKYGVHITLTSAASPVAGVSAGKLNQYGLTPPEWHALVEIGVKLHNALMNEPEGEDWYDGQSLSIMTHLVDAFKAARLAQPSAAGDGKPPAAKYELCDTVFPDGQKCVRPKNHNFSKCSPKTKFMEYCAISQNDEANVRAEENKAKRKAAAALPAPPVLPEGDSTLAQPEEPITCPHGVVEGTHCSKCAEIDDARIERECQLASGGAMPTPARVDDAQTISIPVADIAFASEEYRQALLDKGQVMVAPLPARVEPQTREEKLRLFRLNRGDFETACRNMGYEPLEFAAWLVMHYQATFLYHVEQPTSEGGGATRFYVSSRASIPERSAMWRQYRESGVNIVASWIDEAGEGETADMTEHWRNIRNEIAGCDAFVFYAEPGDMPLKGAFVEAGMAIMAGKPIRVVLRDVALEPRSMRPIGSWLKHPLVRLCKTMEEAFSPTLPATGEAACEICRKPMKRSGAGMHVAFQDDRACENRNLPESLRASTEPKAPVGDVEQAELPLEVTDADIEEAMDLFQDDFRVRQLAYYVSVDRHYRAERAAHKATREQLAGAWENRNRFCHWINEIAQLFWGDDKDSYSPEATHRMVVSLKLRAESVEAENQELWRKVEKAVVHLRKAKSRHATALIALLTAKEGQ